MSSTSDEEHYAGQVVARSENGGVEQTPLRERLVINGLVLLCLGTTLAWVTFLGWLFGWMLGLW